MAMTTDYQKKFNKDFQELQDLYDKKSDEYKQLKYEYMLLESRIKTKERQLLVKENALNEKNKIIEEQAREIKRLSNLLNTDGTNSGISTSKTPINKNKIVPNTRKKTNKNVGGQEGHQKHKLKKFQDDEINDNVDHKLSVCPCCGGTLNKVGEICKDETSYKFVPIKRRHHFFVYKCIECNKEVHENIPVRLKEENQYGSEVQAMALSLSNEGTVAINRIRKLIRGFSSGTIDMSEGYIAKLQKQASKKLEKFKEGVYKELINQSQIYWDDTVIFVNGKRACFRFTGNEKIAYYTAHLKKDEDGIKEDNILTVLPNTTSVMHDHNKINYKYSYQNLECNIHLIRDLQKCFDNTGHDWSKKFKSLVQKIIHDEKTYLSEEKLNFDDAYINDFNEKFDEILLEGIDENIKLPKTHYDKEERALINRILEYKDNYFLWMLDFTLPTNDNLSERALRSIKTKMKVSGQFKSLEYAKYYSNIKTYIETCYRNGINPTDALIRLMEDNPVTIEEIF